MPLYDYECKSCGILFEEFISISERLIPTEQPCPECGDKSVDQIVTQMNIGDPVRLGVKKPSGEFNHIIEQISEQNPRSKLHQKLSQGKRKKGLD